MRLVHTLLAEAGLGAGLWTGSAHAVKHVTGRSANAAPNLESTDCVGLSHSAESINLHGNMEATGHQKPGCWHMLNIMCTYMGVIGDYCQLFNVSQVQASNY